jgi:type II secretory pathway component PulK
MALVLTLLMLTLIIAMVVEFSHGVYTTTSLLVSWKESQRLTAMAKSGVNLAIAALSDPLASSKYRTVGRITIPIQEIVEGFSGAVTVTAEDEGAKFNLNSLRYPVGRLNREAHLSLKRLLRALELDERLADGIANRLSLAGQREVDDSDRQPVLEMFLAALKRNHAFLLKGDVFTEELINWWLQTKRAEVDALVARPHPYEFCMYFDV